jgi:hypothetical protein
MIYMYGHSSLPGAKELASMIGATWIRRFDGLTFATPPSPNDTIVCWGKSLPSDVGGARVINGDCPATTDMLGIHGKTSDVVRFAAYWGSERPNSMRSPDYPKYYCVPNIYNAELVFDVVNGTIVRVGRKEPIKPLPKTVATWTSNPEKYAHPHIRSKAYGWYVAYPDGLLPDDPYSVKYAVNVVKALGLDFGLVYFLYREGYPEFRKIELAPALTTELDVTLWSKRIAALINTPRQQPLVNVAQQVQAEVEQAAQQVQQEQQEEQRNDVRRLRAAADEAGRAAVPIDDLLRDNAVFNELLRAARNQRRRVVAVPQQAAPRWYDDGAEVRPNQQQQDQWVVNIVQPPINDRR